LLGAFFGVLPNFCPSAGQTTCPRIYTHNKLGEVLSMTYPSGRAVNTGYDAAGRPLSVQNGTTQAYYPNPVQYAPNGLTSGLPLGNGLVEATTFNQRFQPIQLQAGSLLTLNYAYTASGVNNNGNIQTASIYDPTSCVTFNQSFTYDGVNRLAGGTEAGGDWTQGYSYDAYGNRALVMPGSSDASGGPQLVFDATGSSTTVPFNTNNHWTAAGGSYDARGNLNGSAASPNSFSGTYDAENRPITTVSAVGGTTTTTNYTYDGDGKRVTKSDSGGNTTRYLYDAHGHLTAEYSSGTNPEEMPESPLKSAAPVQPTLRRLSLFDNFRFRGRQRF
jgi:YD repeat-containing protein